jgi:predicted dehydrogenase
MMAVRAILVGAGGFGRCWWDLLTRHPDVRVVAVVEPDPRARDEAARFFGLPATRCIASDGEPGWQDVQADFVVDCSPMWHHARHGLEAMRQGRHYLVAKPMAGTMREARQLCEAAASHGVLLAVAQQMRYFDCFRLLRELVAARALGEPLVAEVRMALDGRGWEPGTEWRLQMDHPVLMEAGVHHLDLIRWCLDEEFSVPSVNSWRAPGSPFTGDDCVSVHLAGAHGTRVCYQASFAPAPEVPIRFDSGWDVHCEKGTIRVRDGSVLLLPVGQSPTRLLAGTGEPQSLEELNKALFTDFAEALRHGAKVSFDGADNLKTMRLLMDCVSQARRPPS